LGNSSDIIHINSWNYKNINEVMNVLDKKKHFRYIIFIGHASKKSGKFKFKNHTDIHPQLEKEHLDKIVLFLDKSNDAAIFIFTCKGEVYQDTISKKYNYIYTKESSNNPEVEIYCSGFFYAFECGNNLENSHEAGLLFLKFILKSPINCQFQPKSKVSLSK